MKIFQLKINTKIYENFRNEKNYIYINIFKENTRNYQKEKHK